MYPRVIRVPIGYTSATIAAGAITIIGPGGFAMRVRTYVPVHACEVVRDSSYLLMGFPVYLGYLSIFAKVQDFNSELR